MESKVFWVIHVCKGLNGEESMFKAGVRSEIGRGNPLRRSNSGRVATPGGLRLV